MDTPLARIRWTATSRLIPSRYPSVGLFDTVASADDLEAVLELEAWTNDRISSQLGMLATMPRDEWVLGQPMASVVMAAFCHPAPGGGRFSSPSRGAWYAGRHLETAIAESVHRRTRELEEVGHFDTRVVMRLYRADFDTSFHDLRGRSRALATVHDADSYVASQALAAALLADGSNGVVYRSVRHEDGECIACFRPRLVKRARVAAHYEFRWDGSRTPAVRRLNAAAS
jgi:hypothetical protein